MASADRQQSNRRTGPGAARGLGTSRIAALTGLRGVAASSVVVYHVWLYGAPDAAPVDVGPFERFFTNLDVGVTFFFVLSGFLLYRSYARSLITGAPRPRVRNFAIARVLRIVPAYWLILLVTVALTERSLFDGAWRFVANAFFLQYAIPSFLPHDLASANGSIAIVPSWSLGVEAGFYISLPLVAAGADVFARRTGRRVLAVFLPVAALAVVGAASIAVEHVLSGNVLRDWQFGFPIHAGFFACGMAGTSLALLWQEGRFSLDLRTKAILGLLALILGGVSVKLHHRGHLTWVDYQWPIAITLSVFLLFVLLAPEHGRLQSSLGSRLLVATGLASYSIFLVHDQIIREVRRHSLVGGTVGGFLVELTIVAAATAAATFASYRLVEKPCFALKRRLTAVPAPPEELRQSAAPPPPKPLVDSAA